MTQSAILQQPTFSTGEVSPSLYGRVDLSRYASSLSLCQNFFVKSEGGVSKRPGTKFVCPVKDCENPPRLIEFRFSSDDTYILEFGDRYMRVIRNGELLRKFATFSATAAAGVGGARFTRTAGTLPSAGSQIVVTSVGNALSMRGRFLEVRNRTGDGFDLVDWETGDRVALDADMAGETITFAEPLEYETVYSASEVGDIKYAQSADVLYLAHPNHPPTKVSRVVGGAFPTFVFRTIVFNDRILRPFTPASSRWVYKNSGASADYPNKYGSETYVYTASDSTGQNSESLPSNEFTASRDAGWAATGGEACIRLFNFNGGVFPAGADTFNIYKRVGGIFLFIGSIDDPTTFFDDTNLTPAAGAESPPENFLPLGVKLTYSGAAGGDPQIGSIVTGTPSGATGTVTFVQRGAGAASGTIVLSGVSGTFTTADTIKAGSGFGNIGPGNVDAVVAEFPSTVTFFEDRLSWASSTLNPQTVWMSQSGDYENFARSQASVPSDGMEFTINARQVNKIEAMAPLNDLLLLTSGAVWAASGAGENEPIAPDSIRVRVQSFNGASDVEPLFIEDTILYVEDKNRTVRDLSYEFATDSYRGNDLSVMSRHLFESRTITDWALAKSPFGLIWCVMSDGDLTCLTYMREHDVRGWSRHVLGGSGFVRGVASVPETTSDTGRAIELDCPYFVVTRGDRCHIERLQPREYNDLKDCWFLDSAVKVDSGEGASNDTVYGLWHLEGETIWALNGGNVEEDLVVSSGRVTLNNPSVSDPVLLGFPYVGGIETLDFNIDAEGGALHAQRRRTSKIFIRTRDTRGLEVAQDAQSKLNPVKERLYVPNSPIALVSDVIEAVPTSEWSRQGKVYVEASYPLPAEVLSIMPLVTKGG